MRRPRVKPEHQPYRSGERTVRIGGEIYGLASEISDPYGCAWAALELMDGSRDRQTVVECLRRRFPGRDVEGVVDTLLASGHVEDADAPVPEQLDARQRARYSRNADYFRWIDLRPREHQWEPQLRLRRSRVVVLGMGGTGCHAAWALAAAGVGAIHCVDPDEVELSNLNRQMLFGEADIGRAKVEAALARMREINSDIEITGEIRRIGSQEELSELIAGCDVLALCADEPRVQGGIRRWANRASAAAGIPWVGGGYAGPQVSVGVFAPGYPCFECFLAEGKERGHVTDFAWPGVIATSAGISGLLVAQGVITLLTGVPEVPPGYVHGVNLVAPDDRVYVRYPSRGDCVVCGRD